MPFDPLCGRRSHDFFFCVSCSCPIITVAGVAFISARLPHALTCSKRLRCRRTFRSKFVSWPRVQPRRAQRRVCTRCNAESVLACFSEHHFVIRACVYVSEPSSYSRGCAWALCAMYAELEYISVGCNRTPHAADWSVGGQLTYAGSQSVALTEQVRVCIIQYRI